MKILFTGASSFTRYWFVRRLAIAGLEVVCPLRSVLSTYAGVREKRVRELQSLCRIVENVSFGSERFITLIHEQGPWAVLCHHAAEVADYKNPDFDIHAALLNNTRNLRAVLVALKQAGGSGVVLTGSVFEDDEGEGDRPLRAFSPYGLSKGLSWDTFRYFCTEVALPLGKFVIPNPFGPFEEPRFTNYLMRTWSQGIPAEIKTPDYIRDNIHVDLLAECYAAHVDQLLSGGAVMLKCNPSGYAETQGAFSTRVAQAVRARSQLKCDLILRPQAEFAEPTQRVNTQPAVLLIPQWNEAAAWDAFANYYCR